MVGLRVEFTNPADKTHYERMMSKAGFVGTMGLFDLLFIAWAAFFQMVFWMAFFLVLFVTFFGFGAREFSKAKAFLEVADCHIYEESG